MGEVNMGLAIIFLCMLKSIGLQMFTQSKYDREWVSPLFLCVQKYIFLKLQNVHFILTGGFRGGVGGVRPLPPKISPKFFFSYQSLKIKNLRMINMPFHYEYK